MKNAIVIFAVMLSVVAACASRPEVSHQKTTTTTTSTYDAPALEPVDQKRTTTITVQQPPK